MKKIYCIFYREIENIQTYYPSEKFSKFYSSGVKNEFFSSSDAYNFILNPENLGKFSEHCEYFVLPIFTK